MHLAIPTTQPGAVSRDKVSPGRRATQHIESQAQVARIQPRSVSADATAPQHELLGAIQLLRQQLSFLVQAWMADRERLEPQKQQADEELARLQTTMESARQQWSNERAAMEQQLDALRTQVHVLQEENAAYKSKQPNRDVTNNGTRQAPGQPLGSGSITGMSSSSSDPAAAILSPNPSLQSGSSKADILSLPPGLDGASRRPHFASLGSTRTSPIGHPAPLQVAALDPRILPQKSADKDFLAPPSSDDKLLTIIDVHEIDPKLEGIPIKANALKRATFSPPRSQSEMSPSSRRLGQDLSFESHDSEGPNNASSSSRRVETLDYARRPYSESLVISPSDYDGDGWTVHYGTESRRDTIRGACCSPDR
ncbi:tho complex subunit 7 domain-containing protein [Purpureocillium lavendulum]|uniref:Tho complex subunit 7 domain-containing protein n=1 Tax=Purpureocillium lavendulum TaxID=1247861 RepID=A0AB34FXV5_9HYPO|nr:tho complex subunit 7 domain-containing protein [Purpureocillium lavendulum]